MGEISIINIYNLCREILEYKPNETVIIPPSLQSTINALVLKPVITPKADILFEIAQYFPKVGVESICFVKSKDLNCTFYRFLNNVQQILLFDYENCILYGYTMEKVNRDLIEIKIVQVDLYHAQERVIFNFSIDYLDQSPEDDSINPLYISALSQRYFLTITPNIPNYPTKIAKIIDAESKEEIQINPYLFENHNIFEIADFKVIQTHESKKYLLIKTGRICSFEKRDFHNSNSAQYTDKIETLIVAPIEELIDKAISQKKIDFSKYIIAMADQSQTIEFEPLLHFDKMFAPIIAKNLPFFLYSKESFNKNSVDIFKFDLEKRVAYKIATFEGETPFINCDDKGYFLVETIYSNLPNSNLQKLILEKIYLENGQRTKEELMIEKDEIFEKLYSYSSKVSFIVTKNALKGEFKVYFLDDKKSYLTIKFDEGFVPVLDIAKNEINAFIIYPYFVKKLNGNIVI